MNHIFCGFTISGKISDRILIVSVQFLICVFFSILPWLLRI